jgi:hypothetical protein
MKDDKVEEDAEIYSYTFVEDCEAKGKLQDLSKYR